MRPVADRHAVRLLRSQLHAGESEVLVLGHELSAVWVVLDDLDARRIASRLGLQVVGTIGLLLAAKQRGDIPSLRIELDRLLAKGFRLSPKLRALVLARAGEAPEP